MMPITQKGYDALKEKIKAVKIEFDKTPAQIGLAREKGDLKENAEYHAAREKQGMLKAELDQLNHFLSSSQIIDPSELPADIVTFGKVVEMENLSTGLKEKHTIVGEAEADFENNLISVTSQLVKGILGKKKDDLVKIMVPSGEKEYQVLSIKYYQ